jgi:hypothetical protein
MTAMRKSIVAALLLLSTTAAIAQPGADPAPYPPQPQGPPQPMYPPPPPQPYYPPQQPQPYYPPGPGYGPPIQLTPEDQELLAQGEISDGQYIGGAALAVFMGLGIGQAVQGRWSERGYIFTFGEIGTFALMMYGAVQLIDDCSNIDGRCSNSNNSNGTGALVAGLVGYSVFRIWDIVDSISGPAEHNARLRDLRIRTGYRPMGTYGRIKPFVAPGHDEGVTAGISFRF